MLLRAWNGPWTPQSHRSYSTTSKEAIKTLLLCCRRYQTPSDVHLLILSHISRNWWCNEKENVDKDERQSCWNEQCQLEYLAQSFERKDSMHERGLMEEFGIYFENHEELKQCQGCGVAAFCCDHWGSCVNHEGHGTICGIPPIRIPGKEEEELCIEVAKHNLIPCNFLHVDLNSTKKEGGDDDNLDGNSESDDESSNWESIHSSEEEISIVSTIIHDFFYERRYRRR